MDKHYIVINLNKAESAETRQARVRERVRWGVFGVLIVLLLGVNVRVWMISSGYDGIIGLIVDGIQLVGPRAAWRV